MTTQFAIVIPTVGRRSLWTLVDSLAACEGPRPASIVIVDDRPSGATSELDPAAIPGWLRELTTIIHTAGRGPAAARNAGWRRSRAPWIAFLDDDVRVTSTWLYDLQRDLAVAPPDVGGIEARITVPPAAGRRPTDWERGTAGLADAQWITADFAYRRSALVRVQGFDERFPRAFREDADLALRVSAAGFRLLQGNRRTDHPIRPAPWTASVRQQRGNADDALMAHLHGSSWHTRAGATVGRRPAHLLVTAAALVAALATLLGRPRVTIAAAAAWLLGTAEFSWRRIEPGPRDASEVARMVATSCAIPPVATWHWLRGCFVHRRAAPWPSASVPVAQAILFDRDGTLVKDVPYNADPDLVEPMQGARAALDAARRAGLKVGVISNQSGVARGLLTIDDLAAVNRRVDQLLGPFDDWQICPHLEREGCRCRKPEPGMIIAAAAALGVKVERCVVVGDIGSDVDAARAAGTRGFLIPTAATLPAEIERAAYVFDTIEDAVDAVVGLPARSTTEEEMVRS